MSFYPCRSGGGKKVTFDRFTISSDGKTATYNFGTHFKSYEDFVANARWALIQISDARYKSSSINQSGSVSTDQVDTSHDGSTYYVKARASGAYSVAGNVSNFICF